MEKPKQREILKQLCEHLNLPSLPVLARNIGCSASNLYNISAGTRPMSDSTARAIVSRYPEINMFWLLGEDDHMLIEDARRAEYNKEYSEYKMRFDGMWAIVESLGYGREVVLSDDGSEMYRITKKTPRGRSTVCKCSQDEIDWLSKDLIRYAEFRINNFWLDIKRKEEKQKEATENAD